MSYTKHAYDGKRSPVSSSLSFPDYEGRIGLLRVGRIQIKQHALEIQPNAQA